MKNAALLTLSVGLSAMSLGAAPAPWADALSGVATRYLGEGKARVLRFEATPFGASYFAADTNVVIAAPDVSSAALTLGTYLREVAHAHWSWCGKRVPETLPLPSAPTEVRRAGEIAFAYNYCTLSYTFAFRGERSWREEIDRLALFGFNRALVIAGLPKVWQLTLRELGFSEDEIAAFLPDAAASAWWCMGNLEGLGGPLDAAAIDRDAALGRYLVREMRAVGIEPVLQAFTGLIPSSALKNPARVGLDGTRLFDQGEWCGKCRRPVLMDPTSSAFARFAQIWYRHLFEVYGIQAAAGFAGDLFHEGGKAEGIEVTQAVRAVQAAQQRAAPGATWFVQAWGSNPTDAILAGLDPRHTIIEKLVKDMSAGDRDGRTYGQIPFIWCELLNFGGNHGLYGNIDLVDRIPSGAGWGLLSEGLETNPWFYEEFTRRFAALKPETTADYARRRYGTDDPRLVKALDLLRTSVYRPTDEFEGAVECVYCAFPSWEANAASTWGPTKGLYYNPTSVVAAAELYAAVAKDDPALVVTETFLYDWTDIRRQVLSDRARQLLPEIRTNDCARAAFVAGAHEMEKLLSDCPRWTLGYYEQLAAEIDPVRGPKAVRRMYTSWLDESGWSILRDYAHRQLAGLIVPHYLARWENFFLTERSPK